MLSRSQNFASAKLHASLMGEMPNLGSLHRSSPQMQKEREKPLSASAPVSQTNLKPDFIVVTGIRLLLFQRPGR